MSIRSLWLKTSKQESVFVKYVSFCIISSAEESWFVFPWAKYNLSSGEAHQHRDSVRKELKTGRRRGRRYKKLRRWRLNRLQEKKVGRIIIAPFFCFYLRLKEGFFLRINWIPQLIRFPHRRLNTNCTVKKQSNGLILTDCCRDLNQQPSSSPISHTQPTALLGTTSVFTSFCCFTSSLLEAASFVLIRHKTQKRLHMKKVSPIFRPQRRKN